MILPHWYVLEAKKDGKTCEDYDSAQPGKTSCVNVQFGEFFK